MRFALACLLLALEAPATDLVAPLTRHMSAKGLREATRPVEEEPRQCRVP
jgi:hypothetical protein